MMDRIPWWLFAVLVVASIFILLLVGCGAPVNTDQDRRDCENQGGTFVTHSDGEWECQYNKGATE